MNLVIFVNHLLGIGHLQRAALLAHALGQEHHVTLISGGMPVPHFCHTLNLVQLPPLKAADESFSGLVTDKNTEADADYFRKRQEIIRNTISEVQPDCLITEHFPFGRRKLKQDFKTFLDAGLSLKKRPLIAASVRDILVSSAKQPNFQSLPYDLIFVHGDEKLKPAWGFVQGPELIFTGYTCETIIPEESMSGKIIVVAGGRSISDHLNRALGAVAKHRKDSFIIRGDPPSDPLPNCVYTPFIPDLAQKIPSAKLLISEAGYNSFLNSIVAQTPTIFIPFHSPNENEQLRRLEHFNVDDWAEMILPEDLNPQTLAQAIQNILTKQRIYPHLNLKGIENTVRILNERLAQH